MTTMHTHRLSKGDRVTIIKQNHRGQETWCYAGRLLVSAENHYILEAFFDREDMQFHGLSLCKGDRFVETYYTDHWYNIIEIHAREDDHLRGWYCNISCPVKVQGSRLSYIDLALDLLVFPDGRQMVLDIDEFEALDISTHTREQALIALEELKELFEEKSWPFDDSRV